MSIFSFHHRVVVIGSHQSSFIMNSMIVSPQTRTKGPGFVMLSSIRLILFSLLGFCSWVSPFAPSIEPSCVVSSRQEENNNAIAHASRILILRRRMISSGFSFSDGEQILVSAQKPLGIVLEQDSESGIITVAEVDPSGSAGKGGVKVGDILVAVQNASTENVDLDDVLAYIGNGPRVMNLRLIRAEQ